MNEENEANEQVSEELDSERSRLLGLSFLLLRGERRERRFQKLRKLV